MSAGKHIADANGATLEALRGLWLGYKAVTELPATIADGVMLLYQRTVWRGLVTGESSLPAGTPWPVKGYKELTCAIRHTEGQTPTLLTQINDFNQVVLEYVSDGNKYQIKTNESVTYEQSFSARFGREQGRTHHPPLYYAEEAAMYVYPDIEVVILEPSVLVIEMRMFQADANLKGTTNSVPLSSVNIGDPYYIPTLYYYPPPLI